MKFLLVISALFFVGCAGKKVKREKMATSKGPVQIFKMGSRTVTIPTKFGEAGF